MFLLDGRRPVIVACGNIPEILAGSIVELREPRPKGPPKIPCRSDNSVALYNQTK